MLGAVELARGRRNEAEQAFKTAITLDPKQVVGHLALANRYWAAGRMAEAGPSIERRSSSNRPTRSLIGRWRCFVWRAAGRGCRGSMKVVAQSAPLARRRLYLAAGRPNEAIQELERQDQTLYAVERLLVRACAARRPGEIRGSRRRHSGPAAERRRDAPGEEQPAGVGWKT